MPKPRVGFFLFFVFLVAGGWLYHRRVITFCLQMRTARGSRWRRIWMRRVQIQSVPFDDDLL
jgi:hypothetical protein